MKYVLGRNFQDNEWYLDRIYMRHNKRADKNIEREGKRKRKESDTMQANAQSNDGERQSMDDRV